MKNISGQFINKIIKNILLLSLLFIILYSSKNILINKAEAFWWCPCGDSNCIETNNGCSDGCWKVNSCNAFSGIYCNNWDKKTCWDGSKIPYCKTCPPQPSVCTPNQWDNCGSHSCGGCYSAQCKADGSGWACVWNPATCCPPPVCTVTAPSAPTLTSPTNNSTQLYNDQTLAWNAPSSWGNNCGTGSASYRTYFATCGTSPLPLVETGTDRATLRSDLAWNTQYCWYVQAHNGASGTNSATWNFRTAQTPSQTSINVQGDFCGNRTSGSSSIAGTSNPITYVTNYQLTEGGVTGIKEAMIGIVPSTVRNASIISEDSLASASADYFAASAMINTVNPALSQFKIINTNSSPYYSSTSESGNLSNTNGTATLMNINSGGTRVEYVDANNIRIYWQIRFDNNFARTKNANVYAGAFRQLSSGQWNSSTGSNSIDKAVGLSDTWSINTKPALVNISNPTAINATDFSITWGYTDGFEVTQATGYMWTNSSPLSMQRLTPSSLAINLTNSEPADFSASNVGVTLANLGTHSYRLPDNITNADVINTKMSINDSACNKITDSGSILGLNRGWLATAFGDIYSINFDITPIDVTLDPPLTGLNGYSYLSTYTTSVSDANVSSSQRSSKYDYILESYDDWNAHPPKSSSSKNWYDFLKNLVESNSTIEKLSTQDVPDNYRSSTLLGVTKYSTRHVITDKDLNIGKNFICDTRSIIFVTKQLKIQPDLTIENNGSDQMGCMFIVSKDIYIYEGDPKNLTTGLTDPIQYDKVEGFFITDNNLRTYLDASTPTAYDGLYIHGSFVVNNATFGRDLKMLNNARQPAEMFEFDPRYSVIFANELNIKQFSIREKGYVKNVFD